MEARLGYGFPSPLTASEEFCDTSASFMTVDSNNFTLDDMVFSSFSDDALPAVLRSEQYNLDLEGFDPFSILTFQDVEEETSSWIDEHNVSLMSRQASSEDRSTSMSFNSTIISSREELSASSSLFLTGDNGNTDRDLSVFHLLKAYGEAKANDSVELARIIQGRLDETVSPLGTITERLGHYLLQGSETSQSNYLVKESIKNYATAFRAFYEICPYGRFAHFVANSAILDSVPNDVEAIHIIDFDVGEGVQWPPLLAALGPRMSVQITCVDHKVEEGDSSLSWRFEKTKDQLCAYANSMGLKLKVDEMHMGGLADERRWKARANAKEWLVFNCMVGLPHMGVPRRRGRVRDFTRVAEELIASSGSISNCGHRARSGILTYGGLEMGNHRVYSDGHLLHSYALFESMEWHFPPHLSLARTAMECLFIGPCASSAGFQRIWEVVEEVCGFPWSSSLEGCRLSRQNLLEAKEILGGEGSQYAIGVEGHCENEMVLVWRGKPLVRVCAWR